jgi:hypothetical protein
MGYVPTISFRPKLEKTNKVSKKDILKKFMNDYKHLQQFYGTKKEFKKHLLSGEVTINIPDMLDFINSFKNK